MERHVYRPPKGSPKLNVLLALLGGAVMTFAVFYVIPLMKKLEQAFRPPQSPLQEEVAVEDAPEEFEEPDEEPPPEEKEDPPELEELQEPIEIDLPLASLTSGVGKIVIDTDLKFDIREDAEGMFDTGEFDQPPRATSRFSPSYPRELKGKGVGGRVIVGALVDENGTVKDVTLKESSGHRELDQAAMDAIKRWRYKPAIKSGRKVPSSIVQPFNFRVE